MIIAGSDTPRRVVIVAASGLWRWRFRGGASAEPEAQAGEAIGAQPSKVVYRVTVSASFVLKKGLPEK